MLQRYQVGLRTGKWPQHVKSESLILVQYCFTGLVQKITMIKCETTFLLQICTEYFDTWMNLQVLCHDIHKLQTCKNCPVFWAYLSSKYHHFTVVHTSVTDIE